MKTLIQKWGNSLAVRIPKAFAEELGWKESAPVEMTLDGEALVIKTDKEKAWDLDELLARMTDDNLHLAWEAGPAAAFAGSSEGENTEGGGDKR
ncbi:MAG TPA: AbrB/MazE/SpoVT family DNA-binding domain-containing protein [Acidobacteriota bacterium]|nr:AbrB/MazE/SpoVT family DNA-binding domain-containing protein [Acidobacteriota bacterium]